MLYVYVLQYNDVIFKHFVHATLTNMYYILNKII